MNLRRPVPILFASLAAAAALWRLASAPQDGEVRESWVEARPETRERRIAEVGVLEPEVLSRVQAELAGVIAEVVDDGVRVEAGDLLLRIDDEEIRENLEGERLNLEQKREDLENRETEIAVLTSSYEAVSRMEVAEWKHAELKLERGLEVLPPEERRPHEIEIELAELDLEDRRGKLERQRELVEKGFAPESSLDKARREREAAETFLEEKQARFELAKQPLPDEEKLTLKSEMEKAREVARRSGERHLRELAIQKLKTEGLNLEIEHLLERIGRLESDLDKVVHTAPVAGVFRLTRDYSWSARSWEALSVGKKVWRRNVLGTIVDPARLTLRVLVHESDRRWIEAGQPARVTLRAFPGDPLEGVVEYVASLGQDRDDLSPLYQQAPPMEQAMFLARVRVDVGGLPVMPGMTAGVSILVEAPVERLTLPRSALDGLEPPHHVFRRRNGREERVEVEGAFNDQGRFEVAAGLEAGDEVRVRHGRATP